MTISATTGASTISDNYGLVGGIMTDQCIAVPSVVYKSDSTYNVESEGYMLANVGIMSTVSSTADQDVEVTIDAENKYHSVKTIDNSAAHTSEWTLAADSDDGWLQASQSKIVPESGPKAPMLSLFKFDISTVGTAAYVSETNVHGFFMSEYAFGKVPYSPSYDKFEITGVHDESTLPGSPVDASAFSVFDANMPCSSYLMKELVCNNSNALATKTVNRLCFPVVGIGSTI